MRTLALLASALALSGCMSITALGDTFEGGADFTVVPLNAQRMPPAEIARRSPLAQAECANRYCINLQATNRFSTERPDSTAAIQSKDNIYLSLKTGTIGWFSEGAEQHALNRFVELFGARSPVKGEIAIVANVTEGKRSPGSLDDNGQLEGHVIFYSNDIYRRQRLNEFNLPVYGPAPYAGGPLTVDLWVMELDRAESDQMGAILSTLANLARTVPSFAGPGFEILSRIGTSFLKANQDDVIGHITFTMKPPDEVNGLGELPLQVSDIVIRRAEDRGFDLSFNGCIYVVQKGSILDCSPVRDKDNYLLMSVRKTALTQSITPDSVSLAELNKRLAASVNTPALTAAIDQFGDGLAASYAGSSALNRTSKFLDLRNETEVRKQDGDPLILSMQCYALVKSAGPAELISQKCGERAADRQMSDDDFSAVVRRLLVARCADQKDLTVQVLGSSTSSEALDNTRTELMENMLSKCHSPNQK